MLSRLWKRLISHDRSVPCPSEVAAGGAFSRPKVGHLMADRLMLAKKICSRMVRCLRASTVPPNDVRSPEMQHEDLQSQDHRQASAPSTFRSGWIVRACAARHRSQYTPRRPSSGSGPGNVANVVLRHADQPDSSRAAEHGRGADRRWVW